MIAWFDFNHGNSIYEKKIEQMPSKFMMMSTCAFWIMLISSLILFSNYTIMCTSNINLFKRMYQWCQHEMCGKYCDFCNFFPSYRVRRKHSSPVNESSKMANRKKNRVVLKFGRIVEGNVLNNILKVPAGRRWAGGRGGIWRGLFPVFPKYLKNYAS